jgi:hypothetical protein
VGERHISDMKGSKLDGAAALNNPQADLTGQPLLLQLPRDQAGGERRRIGGTLRSAAI